MPLGRLFEGPLNILAYSFRSLTEHARAELKLFDIILLQLTE